MLNRLIFLVNRSMPNLVRNLVMLGFALYLDLKHFVQYGTINMFETVNLETSSSCNRKCSYCPVSRFPRPQSNLSMKAIFKIAANLKQIGFKGEIAFTGYNEPLMDSRIVEIIKVFRNALPKNKLIIYTNGDFLTAPLLKKLNQWGVLFNISIHEGKQPALHNNKELNVRRNMQERILSTRAGLVEVKHPQNLRWCILPKTQITIDYKGNVILCSDDYFSSVVWGNIKKQGLMQIWSKYKKARLLKPKLELCKECIK
jgi:GTP 3',8-cyclase